jgi:hypothetical protein
MKEKRGKRPLLQGFGGKVLGGWFSVCRTERLLLEKRCSTYDVGSIKENVEIDWAK